MLCRIIAASFVIVILSAAGARDSNAQHLDSTFLRLETQWMDALARKDTITLSRILAPEFTIIGAGASVNNPLGDRATWLANATRRPWPRHDVRIVRVHDLGTTAVVHLVLGGDYPPRSLTPEGGRVTFLVTDTWTRRGNDWNVVTRHSSLVTPNPR